MALTTWTSTEAGQITLGDYRASDHRASEVSGERERYAFGGGFLPRPHHRHQRDRDQRAPANSAAAAINIPKRAKPVRRRLVALKIMTMKRCGWVEDGMSTSSSANNGGGRRGFGSKITCAQSSPRAAHKSTAAPNHLLLTPCSLVAIGSYPAGSCLRRSSRS